MMFHYTSSRLTNFITVLNATDRQFKKIKNAICWVNPYQIFCKRKGLGNIYIQDIKVSLSDDVLTSGASYLGIKPSQCNIDRHPPHSSAVLSG